MVIAIDFDGTCVTHAFPNVGKEIGAVDVIKALVNKGHKIILFTMRDLEYLTPAVAWFEKNDIPLYGINDNPGAKWSTSRKVYADIYIDDMALGIPLKMDYNKSNRPFVDWTGVESLLKKKGIL
jgi:hydroxymethylpyrimidine pyrophosphatase-like HAD family hydrolase